MDRYRGLLERYVELYNAGDLDGVMDLYAEDAVQLMPDGTFEGRSAIRDRLAKELAAFADIAHRYVSYVEQGDAFADEWVFAVNPHANEVEGGLRGEHGITVVDGGCPLMFEPTVGFGHKVMRVIYRGHVPKTV